MDRVNRTGWLTAAAFAILWCSAAHAGVSVFDQQAKLLPGDGAASDSFGYSVAVDGETLIVGARYDDDNGSGSGTAYLFHKVGSRWSQTSKLLPDDGAAKDYFGRSVAVDGGAAVVGAYRDDDLGNASGSAYVFQQTDSGWNQAAKLLPGDGQADDLFGYAVSLSGRTALVGAYGNGSGSAYIFEDSGAGWQQTAKLVPADGADDDRFGYTVAINDDTAVVGARFDDDNGTDSGSAYVFRRNGAAWEQVAKLLPDDGEAGDKFGKSVAVDGRTLIVGTYRDDDNGHDAGAAYVFRDDGSQWTQTAKLLPGDGKAEDKFGHSVSLSEDLIVVGARWADPDGTSSGAAYVFRETDSKWIQIGKLLPGDGAEKDYFGVSVAVDGTTAVIGAHRDDDMGSNSGSAYVMAIPEPGTLLLLAAAGACLLLRRRGRRRS